MGAVISQDRFAEVRISLRTLIFRVKAEDDYIDPHKPKRPKNTGRDVFFTDLKSTPDTNLK